MIEYFSLPLRTVAENKRNSLNVTALKDFSLMKKQRKFKKRKIKKFLTNEKQRDIIAEHVWRDIEVVITRRS